MSTILLSTTHYESLRRHLFQNDVEHVAFGFTTPPQDANPFTLQIQDLHFVQPNEYVFQSAYHVELHEDTHARLIKTASDQEAGLIEFHSHLSDYPARFSPTDITGFSDFVPHIMWRLPNRPYAAVVLHHSSLDGLIWPEFRGPASPLISVGVGSSEPITTTGLTMKRLSEDEI